MGEIERSLTVGSVAGLANRLQVLVSGLIVAEASQRQFTMLWATHRHCGAAFSDLFANDWPVQAALLADVLRLPNYRRQPDLLASDDSHLTLQSTYWLVDPACYPQHRPLVPRCQEVFRALRPKADILEMVRNFQTAHFRAQMIGVHLRRGDFVVFRPNIAHNLSNSFRAVDKLLTRLPDAGILLATDDGAWVGKMGTVHVGVREAYRQRYGDRVVTNMPRVLDRGKMEAVQDALVDLWLLRSVDAFVGTIDSSFSSLAAYDRDIPTMWAGPDSWRYQVVERTLSMTGLGRVMLWDGRRRYGRNLLLVELLRIYRQKAHRWLSSFR